MINLNQLTEREYRIYEVGNERGLKAGRAEPKFGMIICFVLGIAVGIVLMTLAGIAMGAK